MSRETIEKLIRIFLGIMFLFSGVSKLFPIEAFEVTTWQQGLVSLQLAPYFSRLMISFEILLGLLFLLNYKMRKFTLPASFGLLVIFTIYLAIIELTGKGGENCGCFGELIPMTGIQSIAKNILFMGMTGYLFFVTKVEKKASYLYIATGFVLIFAGMLLVFNIKPYEVIPEKPTEREIAPPQIASEIDTVVKLDSVVKVKELKDSSKLTKNIDVKKEKPKLSEKFPQVVSTYSNLVAGVDTGLKIVAFLSLDCEHCLQVATELNAASGYLSRVKRHYLFLGMEEEVESFFTKSGGAVAYTMLTPQKFYPYLNSAPPKVILLANGNVVQQMEGNAVSVSQLIINIQELTDKYLF